MNDASADPARLESLLGHSFSDPALLRQALTHTSADSPHMERLEFLGDAVLGMVIAEELFRRFPDEQEGRLTRMRATLVCRAGLLCVAEAWQVDGLLNVGTGERDAEGRVRSESIRANAVESVIGALFLDAGWPVVQRVVAEAWRVQLDKAGRGEVRDAKTRLQEFTQARDWGLPEYAVADHGAGSVPRFSARCMVRGDEVGRGSGERKKIAESEAARQAWNKLNP